MWRASPKRLAAPPGQTAFAVLPLETGFEAPGIAVIGEQDILGDRLVRRRDASAAPTCSPKCQACRVGDLVVHADHGIGRFVGLAAIEAAGEPHDCLEVHYAGGDKLYLPVENIELLQPLRLRRVRRAARQARRRRLAVAQGAPQEAHPRHGREADQGRGHARAAPGAGAQPAGRRL